MKIYITFLATVLISFSVFAQALEVTPGIVEMHHDNLDLTDNYVEEVGVFDVTNLLEDSIDLYWVRIISPDCNPDWQFPIGDPNQHYGANISSNYMEDFGIDIPIVVAPQETTFHFGFAVKPKGQAGCCTAYLELYLNNSLDSLIETVEFDIRINNPECLVSTSEEIAATVRIFPNPVTDHFRLEDNETNVKKLTIYNTFGQQVEAFNAVNTNNFDVSNLPKGVYLINMLNEESELLKTVKLVKE